MSLSHARITFTAMSGLLFRKAGAFAVRPRFALQRAVPELRKRLSSPGRAQIRSRLYRHAVRRTSEPEKAQVLARDAGSLGSPFRTSRTRDPWLQVQYQGHDRSQ